MTKISTLYDGLSTFVDTNINSGLTDSYVKLPNPYDVISNPDILLNKGYAIAFADGAPFEDGFVGCKVAMQRDFEITIYRQITAGDYDTTSRNTLEKEMFEHWFKVVKAAYEDPTLGGVVENSTYVSDSGLLFAEEGLPDRFFLINTVFSMTYFETLNN